MKKNDKVSFVLLICGTIFVVACLILGFVFANSEKYTYKVNDIEVNINSSDAVYYEISVDITLYNDVKFENMDSMSVTLILEDQNGKRINASFGNVSNFQGKKRFKDLSNNSIETVLNGNKNGLDYDLKVVGVTVGTQKYTERKTFNSFFGIPMLASAVVVVLAFAFKEPKTKKDEELVS